MCRSEYVANVTGFSACASKGLQAKVTRKVHNGISVFKAMGFVAGVVLAMTVVF